MFPEDWKAIVDIDTYPFTVHEEIDSECTVGIIFSIPEKSLNSIRDLSDGCKDRHDPAISEGILTNASGRDSFVAP